MEHAKKMPLKWYFLGPIIALTGGVFGIAAAAIGESRFGWYVIPFVAAPIIEEIVKPCGVYLLLVKWPQALPSARHTAFLAALAGLSFAIVENTVYLEVYFPEHTQALVLWRYTVCLLMHMGCSFILGFGINQKLIAAMRDEIPFLEGNRIFFTIPIVIHATYNVSAFLMESQWDWFTARMVV